MATKTAPARWPAAKHPLASVHRMIDPVAIDRKSLLHLAELVQLRLGGERENVLHRRLQDILDAFASLRTVPPIPDPAPANTLALRDDCPEPPMAVAAALANAPRQSSHCFEVPRIPPP